MCKRKQGPTNAQGHARRTCQQQDAQRPHHRPHFGQPKDRAREREQRRCSPRSCTSTLLPQLSFESRGPKGAKEFVSS